MGSPWDLIQFPCNVKTTGFQNIQEGKGIRAFIPLDSAGGLVVEAGIPLAAFMSDPRLTECMSLSFEINEQGL